MGKRRGYVPLIAVLMMLFALASVSRASFDLSGPRIDVRVQRGDKELPISQVPNLLPGDRLWLHPEIPESQSVHYLLIVAFLRGPTNPPPDAWFTKAETWAKGVHDEGIHVTVPEGAEQVLLFLAPSTGGDFSTLRNAVQGRPGAFVRAAQDLNQAALDRSRIDTYFTDIKEITDPQQLRDSSVLLARSLQLKLNKLCFDKPAEQQIPCLTAESGDLVLNDGHSQSMVAAITSGPSADLIGAVTSMPMAGGGFYYSYLGVFFDLAHLMDNLHTAQFQYIPALGLPHQDWLDIKLNNPPSFHKPKSVLVATLPAVEATQLPPLRAAGSKQEYCLEKSPLVLPVEGAPLIFSTSFAHDFSLRLQAKSGQPVDLPAVPDPTRGGFVVDTHSLRAGEMDSNVIGTLRGVWGFEPMAGPSYILRGAHSSAWTVPAEDRTALILGREDVIHLQAGDTCCVAGVEVKDHSGKSLQSTWKTSKPGELEVKVWLQDTVAGAVSVSVKQHGLAEPDKLTAPTYAEAARLDSFTVHAGDREGILQGERLDEVEALRLGKTQFVPADLTRTDQKDILQLTSITPAVAQPADKQPASALLKDGRVLTVIANVEPPRPAVTLISKVIALGDPNTAVIHLGNPDDLPLNGKLSFVVRTSAQNAFPRTEKIEVSNEDQSAKVLLSVAEGTLTLQDSATVLAVLDPLKSFGPSTFGALRFRPVDSSGAWGDWQPLATLVRLPDLEGILCPPQSNRGCALNGSNLFLIESIASDPQFTSLVPVPTGISSPAVGIPHPVGKVLYFKLRDDPSAVNSAEVPILPAPPVGTN